MSHDVSNEELAALATDYMEPYPGREQKRIDLVRPAQARSYRWVMPKTEHVWRALSAEPINAHGRAAGLNPEVCAELNAIMRREGLPKSHVWVKGLVAVRCALRRLPEGESSG